MENLFSYYYNKLNTENDSGAILAQFYCSIFGQNNSVDVIRMFQKLIKMYGKFETFNAVVSVYNMTDVDFANIWGMLTYFARKEHEIKYTTSQDLTSLVKENEEKFNKLRESKLKIPNPFKE